MAEFEETSPHFFSSSGHHVNVLHSISSIKYVSGPRGKVCVRVVFPVYKVRADSHGISYRCVWFIGIIAQDP